MSIFGKDRPYVIAEMSGNHNQSLDRAIKIVEAAAEAGVDAVKIQTYTADTMTIDKQDGEFFIGDKTNLWYGETIYSLFQKAYTPWEWHEPIFKRCRELGIMGFSTPFDRISVDFLETLKVPAYKISSYENTDLPLINYVARKKKPLLISTGMASLAELDETVSTAKHAGCEDITLLKCTSNYPASPKSSNLLTIPHMQTTFCCKVGISDHTLGIGASIAAVALGAVVIERHFTLSRADGGVDAAFSLEPQEMRQLVRESRAAWESRGEIFYGPSEGESLKGRRSLYICEDMKSGEKLNEKNLRCIRPGLGLPPKYYEALLGKTVGKDIEQGTPMAWDLLM